EKDFVKMRGAVDLWQVAEFEQKTRGSLHPFLQKFCGRVDTITPLIKASEAVYETMLSRVDLEEKIASTEATNKDIPRAICDSTEKQFQKDRYKVVVGIDFKLNPDTQKTWEGFVLKQWWNNKDESVVTPFTNSRLADQGSKWSDDKFKTAPDCANLNNVELVRNQALQSQATWNVYSRVALNMTLATGSVVTMGVIIRKYLERGNCC
ncbi:MAG: hypothetical protein JSS09_02405, partial [Verrucomicrobia bacterium]|nr:hypothetical protein [Verrucomicrobiota bacterium]